jgi:hypothetical protein
MNYKFIIRNIVSVLFILLFTLYGNDITVLFEETNYFYQLIYLIFILFVFKYDRITAILLFIFFILQIKLLYKEEFKN